MQSFFSRLTSLAVSYKLPSWKLTSNCFAGEAFGN
jgi:hypothetical protein